MRHAVFAIFKRPVSVQNQTYVQDYVNCVAKIVSDSLRTRGVEAREIGSQ